MGVIKEDPFQLKILLGIDQLKQKVHEMRAICDSAPIREKAYVISKTLILKFINKFSNFHKQF